MRFCSCGFMASWLHHVIAGLFLIEIPTSSPKAVAHQGPLATPPLAHDPVLLGSYMNRVMCNFNNAVTKQQ